MSESIHKSVMTAEVVESLRATQGGAFLDCTFGGGGHTSAILEANVENTVTAVDRDIRAIKRGERIVARFQPRLKLIHSPFSEISRVAKEERFDGVLADLGVSTDQLKEGRGFSFADERSLDMRMNEESGSDAHELVNSTSVNELAKILLQGGASNGWQAAQAIVNARPINTAKELAAALSKVSSGKKKVNPATVVFQAIRMAVNSEISEIERLLQSAPPLVKKGGRLSVITFHSIEDKAVTHTMRSWEGSGAEPALWPGAKAPKILGSVITRKAIVPSEHEIEGNPSSRSAKLRVFEFC